MAAPFETVLVRGAVFLWHQYDRLDDPSFAGQTKAKFIVVLSSSAADDPILYVLTTAEKPKHANPLRVADLLAIPAGSYSFFSQPTIIDVAEAGQLEVSNEQFRALYERGAIRHVGNLSADRLDLIMRQALFDVEKSLSEITDHVDTEQGPHLTRT